MWNLKQPNSKKLKTNQWSLGTGGKTGKAVKKKVQTWRHTSKFRDVMYCIVTIIINIVYLKGSKRVDLKSSYHKTVICNCEVIHVNYTYC